MLSTVRLAGGFPEKPGEEPSLFGLWESNANVLTPDGDEFCDPLNWGVG